MRIAILGTRGIPARYGGFETFAEELSTRLASRGHEVTVYCRERPVETPWRGVELRYLPAVHHKYLETLQHTCSSTLDLLRRHYDVALYCNAANAIFTPLARMSGTRVALNVDGLERHRKKWNIFARCWYLLSEALATFCPDEIVSDAERIRDYYQERYGRSSWFIPYGAPIGPVPAGATLPALNLEPRRYFLYVTRFEPENNPLLVRRAFEQVETPLRLALIGDAPYAQDYIRAVKDTRDPRVVIPGTIYGDGYHELQANSFAYIHATEVGGTHPALIEAMGRGALVLYLRTAENEEVAGGAGLPFGNERELVAQLRAVLAMSEEQRQQLRDAAVQRVRERYSWDAVTSAYERLFEALLSGDHATQIA
jgi:glycosyltransferase involved in cell wall biosynthesis